MPLLEFSMAVSKYKAKKEKIKTDLGHWSYVGADIDLSEYFGFVYLVINKTNNKFYIGKKQFWTYKKNSYTKTGKAFWRSYKTSSVHVIEDGKNGADLEYHILGVFKTRAWCNYTEAWLQMALRSITDRDSQGERRWYNNQVAPIRFIPKQDEEQHNSMDSSFTKAKNLIRKWRKLDVIS
jgi:hypothetical protein